MPLVVEVRRDGEVREDIVWDYTALSCLYTVAHIEGDPQAEYNDGESFGALEGTGKFVNFEMTPIYYLTTKPRLVKRGEQVLKRDHTFTIDRDGGTLEFKAGDVLRAWRETS